MNRLASFAPWVICLTTALQGVPPPVSQDLAAFRVPRGLVGSTAVEEARARNQRCFDEDYLALKERMFDDHAGRWIAIVDGALLPRVDESVRPCATLEELVAALGPTTAQTRHRFLWRIGEEGRVRHAFTLCDRPVFAGHALFLLLGHVWILPDSVVQGDPRGETRRLGTGFEPVLDLALSTPDSLRKLPIQAWAANLYGGTLSVTPQVAAELDLALWEIPGEAEMIGVREMRRARLRIGVPAAGFERVLPVAVIRD